MHVALLPFCVYRNVSLDSLICLNKSIFCEGSDDINVG